MSAANARLNLMLPPEVASERQYPTPAGGWQGVRAARALLVVLVAVLFHSALLGRGVFYYRDIGLFWHPQVEAFVRTVAAGSWPVWNPYVGFGRPLLANPNVQVFYPPTWLNLLMPASTYYTLYVVAHFLLTAIGFEAMGRRLGLSRGASLVAAAVWTASGPLTSLVSFWNYLAGACWWPWTFYFADRALDTGRPRAALAWGACVAAPVLAGSPEMALAGTAAVGAFALGRVRWSRSAWAENRPVLTATVVAAVFAVGLSAAQWMPTVAASAGTSRLDIGAEARTFWSVHPLSLLQAVLPAPLDGLPLRPEVRALLFESREPMLPSLYLGMCSIGLAGAAFALAAHPLRRFAAILALVAILLALGRHTPVYAMVSALVPPLRAIRFPAKAMPMAALAWALLCGIGWEAWRAPAEVAPSRWRAFVLVPLCAVALLGVTAVALGTIGAGDWGAALVAPRPPAPAASVLRPTALRVAFATALTIAMLIVGWRRAGGRLVPRAALVAGALAVLDLACAHADPSPLAPAAVLAARSPVADAIRAEPHSRVYSYDYVDPGLPLRQRPPEAWPDRITGTPDQWPGPWITLIAARQRLYPSLVADFGLEGSFHRDTLGLYPTYLVWLNLAERASEGTPAMTTVLRMGSVSHVVAMHDEGLEALVPVARVPGLLVEPVRLFRVPDPLPRVHAVGGARVGDGREGLAAVLAPDFDPSREVLLAAGEPRPSDPAFRAVTRVSEWRPDRLRVEAVLEQPGWVVLADGYDPGWKARLDGQSADVLRADVGLRAVAVPAGAHVLEMTYRPAAVMIGLVVSILSLLAAAGAVAVTSRARAA